MRHIGRKVTPKQMKCPCKPTSKYCYGFISYLIHVVSHFFLCSFRLFFLFHVLLLQLGKIIWRYFLHLKCVLIRWLLAPFELCWNRILPTNNETHIIVCLLVHSSCFAALTFFSVHFAQNDRKIDKISISKITIIIGCIFRCSLPFALHLCIALSIATFPL